MTIKRINKSGMGKIFVKTAILIFGMILCLTKTGRTQTLFFTRMQLEVMDHSVLENNDAIQPYLTELREFADHYLNKGPWSITFQPGMAISGDPHDYYSEAPYWWPDPGNPGAPYIRRDGLRNPDRFLAHKESLVEMTAAVSVLSMAGYFLHNPSYSERATELLRIWFLDKPTRMNPNLDYAQAIPNRSPGRCFGIIDTHNWSKWFAALDLLEKSGVWQMDERKRLLQWFADYLDWLLTSENGQQEKKTLNNHATWWTAQVAALAVYTGRTDILPILENHTKNILIRNQIEGNGCFPEEEKRTRSFDYTLFNLEAFGLICRIFERQGVDLWEWTNDKGGSVKKALDYMVPYLEDPDKWTAQQITEKNNAELSSLAFAGMRYPDAGYLQLYKMRMSERNPETIKMRYDSFRLWLNLWVVSNEK